MRLRLLFHKNATTVAVSYLDYLIKNTMIKVAVLTKHSRRNCCYIIFFIDFAKGKTYKKGVEELNYKYSKRLQVDLLRDSGEVCR